MNECKNALKKYLDPECSSYKKKIYWQWIESNFPKKEIEQAKKELKSEFSTEIKGLKRKITKKIIEEKPSDINPRGNRDKNETEELLDIIRNLEQGRYNRLFNKTRKK